MIQVAYTEDERDFITSCGDKLHNEACHLMAANDDDDFAEEINNLSEICWKIATLRDFSIPERMLAVTNTILNLQDVFNKNELTDVDLFYILFTCSAAYHNAKKD